MSFQLASGLTLPLLKIQVSISNFSVTYISIWSGLRHNSFCRSLLQTMGHNWYILIPKWHLKAFCNAAKPALLEASDGINFSLFPEVCRKRKCRKCCGKKFQASRGKKGKIDRKRGFPRTAWRSSSVLFFAHQHRRKERAQP